MNQTVINLIKNNFTENSFRCCSISKIQLTKKPKTNLKKQTTTTTMIMKSSSLLLSLLFALTIASSSIVVTIMADDEAVDDYTPMPEDEQDDKVTDDFVLGGGGTNGGGGPGTGFGDPHFRTYDGTMFSFHGQCDLVMARSVSFDNGLGLEVHARTQIVTDWSLINNAAIKIGNDIFELANNGTYYYNGVSDINLYTVKMADKYSFSYKVELIEIPSGNDNEMTQEPKVIISIDLGDNFGNSITFQLWKDMITVDVNVVLQDTEGMLGLRTKRGMVGRDRESIMVSANDMGYEWQVQDNEDKLFTTQQVPQFPQQCILPSIDTEKEQSRRRKLHSTTFMKDATTACSHVSADMISFCINDILLTGDIHLAKGYGR